MSQENVEIVKAAIDALNRGDWDAVYQDAAAGFEFDNTRAVGPAVGLYGLDQMRRRLKDFGEDWESVRFEPDEFIEAGENVVVPWTQHYVGRDGIEVRARTTHVFTISHGAIVRQCMYQERQEALEAVGLSGQDAHAGS